MTARPWRAAAYWPWSYRVYTANASAKSEAGLERFAEEHRALGQVVDVWCVLPIPEVEHAAQVAAGSAG